MTEITDYINKDFKPIDSSDTIQIIQDFFSDLDFSHFPVLEGGVYQGSIAAEDVETFDADKKISEYRYILEGFLVRNTTAWLDVLEGFARHHTNVMPVLDENNSYLGYYEINDIIKFLYETPFLKEQGGVIVVAKGILDFSMSEVAQIIETNGGKILGLFISNSTSETVAITVKISIGSINEIIQTFRRYNYDIISEHMEDNYINSLKERSDYLDKYLNI